MRVLTEDTEDTEIPWRLESSGFHQALALCVTDVQPSHCGFLAVLSKMLDVLKRSKRPLAAASAVLARMAATCSGERGWKVRTASRAWSRIFSLSQPVMTTDVGRFMA